MEKKKEAAANWRKSKEQDGWLITLDYPKAIFHL